MASPSDNTVPDGREGGQQTAVRLSLAASGIDIISLVTCRNTPVDLLVSHNDNLWYWGRRISGDKRPNENGGGITIAYDRGEFTEYVVHRVTVCLIDCFTAGLGPCVPVACERSYFVSDAIAGDCNCWHLDPLA